MDSYSLHRALAEGEWRNNFDYRTLQRAAGYVREERVRGLVHETLDPQTETLTGAVQGTISRPYLCALELRKTRGGWKIRSHCDCPVGSRCKHTAAILIMASRFPPETWPGVTSTRRPAAPIPLRRKAKSRRPPDLWTHWLKTLEMPAHIRDIAAPERRLGILLRGDSMPAPELLAFPAWLRPGKTRKGGLVDPQPLYLRDGVGPSPQPPDGWRPEVADALALLLRGHRRNYAGKPWSLIQADYEERALETLLENYPAYLEKPSAPLERGTPLALELGWQNLSDGSQRLTARIEGHEDARLLHAANLWYLLPNEHRYGRVEGDPRLFRQLRYAPTLAPEEATTLARQLAKRRKGPSIPPPTERNGVQRINATPVPVLSLRVLDARHFAIMRGGRPLACARLGFDYAGHRLEPANYAKQTRWLADGRVFEIKRDNWSEETAFARLDESGFESADYYSVGPLPRGLGISHHDYFLHPNRHQPPLAPEDCGPLLEALARDGFRIEYEAGFPHQELVEIDDWEAELSRSENAWFEVALGVTINGERVDLLPVLRRVLADPGFSLTPAADEDANASRRIRLDAGRDIEIPLTRLRQLVSPLLEWLEQGEGGGALRIHATQAATLQTLTRETPIAWRGANKLGDTLALLRDSPRDLVAPAGFRATLRPYQREGLAWLGFLDRAGLGGILADDMGLGKTVQVLAHILAAKAAGRLPRPVLVVAPTSLIGNWREETARFAPALKVLVVHGADRAECYPQIEAHDLVITTYPLLPRDRERLIEREFSLLVLDEAQAIKNSRSQAARVVREIRAARRLAMTGTPLENHLGELWAQLDAVEPGLLGTERQFARLYRRPIEKQGDDDRRERLKRRIAPLILRRRKDDVLSDLPPKTEVVRKLELAKAQRGLYETLRLAQHKRVRQAVRRRGLAQSGIVVLDALLKLRQACCDPRLVKLESARRIAHSAKLDALLELLDGLLAEGRRVLVFSQFTEMLGLIEAALKARKIEYLLLTGQTPGAARAALIRRFQAGEVPVFLVSLKAGGVGLNLTAADSVIHYDPWWNPAVETQATDRAHRIGQDKPVFVYKLICAGTVEEKIQALQARKADLARSMLDGGGSGRLRFSEDDLAELFAPLA